MTFKFARIAALAAFLAVLPPPLAADDGFMPITTPIPLDPANPDNQTLGELSYRGGLVIEPGEEKIGGISGLDWWDGKLYAVTDDGRWLIMTPSEFRDQIVDIAEIEAGLLLDEKGKAMRRKEDADAEAITRGPEGDWLVSFERDHRIWSYSAFDQPARQAALAVMSLVEGAEANDGIETLTSTPDGWLACVQRADNTAPNCLRLSGAASSPMNISAPPPLDERQGVPTGADCASNGVCYLLFRSYSNELGNAAAIVAIGPDGNRETLATWTPPLNIDNFEGLAVREENGLTYLYLVSDNNFSSNQRTLLMKFQVSARAAATPGVPEKVFETTQVVLETAMGEITVALETERAPISAANFLRYVDEGRFDGTVCYRAMRVKGGEQPSGFVQCGTQNRPDRILAPIPHEPTNETGLSHTDGALSMARFDPGTATGDFSIMIKDQRGLDAQPSAEDPALRPGFAVFGYVVDGMEVVHAIHATEIDPNLGEGWLKGEMLARPVKILRVRRVPTDQQ